MIKEPVYQEIRNDCRLLCNVVNESFWTPKLPPQHTNKHFVATFGNEESILHILGYNVNAQCQGQLKNVQKWQFENVQLWQFKMALYD